MRIEPAMKPICAVFVSLFLVACGGSIKSPGQDASAPTGACATLGACECAAAGDRCVARTEACYCPTSCDPNIVCICGGGEFLSCEDRVAVSTCSAQLARVQTLCAGKPFVEYIGGLCGTNPTCVASCLQSLQTVDSCAQIDCYFCPVCDCAEPPPSPLRACLSACRAP